MGLPRFTLFVRREFAKIHLVLTWFGVRRKGMFCRFCESEIKRFRFLNGILVFSCDRCDGEYVTGFGWRKNKMCKLSGKIIKEADEHRIGWRLEELHFEYHHCNGSKIPMNLVDLLDGSCTA